MECNRKYKEMWVLNKILWKNVNYSNFTLFIFTCHILVEWYDTKMQDAYLNSFHLSMNLQIYGNCDFNHPVAYFAIQKSLYFFCARVDEKAANQKVSVRWRHF